MEGHPVGNGRARHADDRKQDSRVRKREACGAGVRGHLGQPRTRLLTRCGGKQRGTRVPGRRASLHPTGARVGALGERRCAQTGTGQDVNWWAESLTDTGDPESNSAHNGTHARVYSQVGVQGAGWRKEAALA